MVYALQVLLCSIGMAGARAVIKQYRREMKTNIKKVRNTAKQCDSRNGFRESFSITSIRIAIPFHIPIAASRQLLRHIIPSTQYRPS